MGVKVKVFLTGTLFFIDALMATTRGGGSAPRPKLDLKKYFFGGKKKPVTNSPMAATVVLLVRDPKKAS